MTTKYRLTLSTLLCAVAFFFTGTSQAQIDRSKAPAPGPAPAIQIGEYKLFTLDNGLKVIVVENHHLPRVSYSISLDVDPVREGDKAGFVAMAGDLLGKGTGTRSKSEIDETVDFIGASLSTNSTGMFGSCLKKHRSDLLGIMGDILMHPSFPQEEIDKYRKQAVSGLASEKTDPNSLSSKIVSVVNFGTDHPYGEFQTEESLGKITRDDLVSYYNRFFKPNVAYLVVVGDITEEEARADAQKYFGAWQKGDVQALNYMTPRPPSPRQVVFVPMPGAVQSVIDITYPIELMPGTQEAITASVLNNILGGSGFSTRLMQNLREDKAYTYGAYSTISPDELVGSFSASASVRNEVTDSAVYEFLFEMKQIAENPVHDTTLRTVKNIMTGSFARSLERPQTIANFALNIEKYKLPKDYYQTYLQKLNALTSADILAAAHKFIKPDNCYITVVGNKEVADKLSRFAGNGKVQLVNADGTAFEDMRPAPQGVTAASVLKRYIDAIGGEAKLAKVKTMERKGSMSFGPMSVEMQIKMKGQQKFVMTASMGGNVVMKQVLDGTKGAQFQMGQPVPTSDDDVLNMKLQADMLAELHYDRYQMKAEIKGLDKVGDEDAYVLEVRTPGGTIYTDYYSVASGLKLRSLSTKEVSGTASQSETLILEYMDVKGMKFPSRFRQIADGQEIEVTFEIPDLKAKVKDSDFVVQ